MNDLTPKIIVGCYTKQQALRALSEERARLEAEMFGKGGKGDRENLEKKFSEEEKRIIEALEVVIFTSFELNDEEQEAVGRKTRGLFGEELMIDFKVDPTLIGGAAISFGGVYRDYSLRAKFEEKKEVLREIYRKDIG